MKDQLIFAGAALNQTPIDWKNNTRNILSAIETAKKKNVDLLCLPELCITGYGCEDLFLSDWIYEKALEVLNELVPYTKDITVSFGFPFIHENRRYNCVTLIKDGRILGITPKQHLANDGVHYEQRWFTPWTPGDADIIIFDGQAIQFGDFLYEIDGLKVGFEICEDAWREETRPGHSHYERGVDIILNPSASHFAFGKSATRKHLVTESSRHFQCTYIYANLLGNESGKMIYDGELIIAENGDILAQALLLSFQDVVLISSLDPIQSAYSENTHEEFTAAESLALFDYLRKSKSKGFVLSLSGGADSSACAVLVSEMLQRSRLELGDLGVKEKLSNITFANEKVNLSTLLTCAYQGTKNSSGATYNSAKMLSDSIGATFYNWLIDEQVDNYTKTIENALGRSLTWKHDDIALQNIQARARSPIIWMLANINNSLLLTTSNRSEGDVGYATMDGDTSGSISPIAGVDKHFVRKWLKWAEKELGYDGLANVNNLTPTAELRPSEQSQTDEDDLMPYPIMVEIERLAIGKHQSPLAVFNSLKSKNLESETLLKSHINKFYRLWSRNQWKRERLAPAFHLDDFNVDPRSWCRFPILSGGFEEELKLLK